MNFYGYKRPDGRVGVRNKVLILPASVCASDTTRIISQQVVGSVTFNNQLGCSQVAPDQQFTMDVMAGYAANPNVYGTVVVSLGCENCQMDLVVKAIQERTNKPLKQVIIQEAGGTLKAIDMAVRYAKEMVEEASLLQKEEFPMSELIIGTECGGSDPTSGLAANPLIGQLSDLIVKEGGTSILSETTEFIGAEHLLARRAINKEVHDRIFEIVHRYEDSLRLVGEEVREGNPSPGNKAGGLTCLEEKSLGCIHKGGHSPVMAVYDYAKQVEAKQGLVIMDTPGNDPSSVAAMVVTVVITIYNTTSVVILEMFNSEGKTDVKTILVNVVKNPLLQGAMVGLVFFFLGIHVPKSLLTPIAAFADATSPVALFVLGGTLHFNAIRGNLKYLVPALSLKLLVLPAVMLALGYAFGLRDLELFLLVAIYGTPVAAASYPMAQNMGGDGELAGQFVVISTVVAVGTLFGWIFFMKSVGLI